MLFCVYIINYFQRIFIQWKIVSNCEMGKRGLWLKEQTHIFFKILKQNINLHCTGYFNYIYIYKILRLFDVLYTFQFYEQHHKALTDESKKKS